MADRLPLRSLRRTGNLLALLTLLSACSGGGEGIVRTPPPAVTAVTAVTVSPGAVALQGVGATGSVTASLTPTTATSAITWRTENASIATVTGNGTSATVTALSGGTTTVIATAGTISGSATITVTPVVRAIIVSPTAAVFVGGSTRITPTFTADPGASQAVNWTSSAPTIATVDATGNITGAAPGSATITVTSQNFPTVTATIAVTVSYPVVRGVVVLPALPSLLQGATRQFTATVDVDAGTSTAVTWTSLTPTVAQVNASGLLTALAPGTTTLRATSVANPTVNGTTLVTVTAPTVRAITLAPSPATVVQSGTRPLMPTIDADAGANTALTWTTTDAAVAQVSASGQVTGVTPGTATIRATSVLVPTVSGSVVVTVTLPPPLISWSAQPSLPTSTLVNAYLNASYSLSNGTAWSVGFLNLTDNRILRFDGSLWTAAAVAPFDRLWSIGGFGDNAWIGSSVGRLARLVVATNGVQTWESMSSPTGLTITFIVGTSISTAVAVTSSQVLVLASGAWGTLPSSGLTITSVAATANDNIVVSSTSAVGGSRLRRWNGTVWSIVPDPPSTGGIVAVAFRGSDIVVTSASNQSAVYNGVAWSDITVPPSRSGTVGENLASMVTCGGQLYANSYNGGRVFRLTGSSWTLIADYGVAIPGSANGQVNCGADAVLRSVGATGTIGRFTGSGWIWETVSQPIKRLAIIRPDLAWAAAGFGHIRRWDGVRWTIEYSDATAAANGAVSMTGLTATADGTVMATGYDVTQPNRIIRRTTSGTWVAQEVPGRCADVWAASSSYALAVGTLGCALRWNGSSWDAAAGALPTTPFSVQGVSSTSALAVGSSGAVSASSRWDGTSWTAVTTPNVGVLRSVRMHSATLAYAVGDNGLLRWDGTGWAIVTLPGGLNVPLRDVSVNSANDVYALTRSASLYRFNGTTWDLQVNIPESGGDALLFGPQSFATIPGFGIIGTGAGFAYHSSTIGALRAGIQVPGVRSAPSIRRASPADSATAPSGIRRPPPTLE